MNAYTALTKHSDVHIGALPWGGAFLTSVNLALPDEQAISVDATCGAILETIMGMDHSKRTAILKIEVDSDTHEEITRIHNNNHGRLMVVLGGVLLFASIAIVGIYVSITAYTGGEVDQNMLKEFFGFMGEVFKTLAGGSDTPAQ